MKARIQWAGEAMFLGESGSGHVVVMDGPPDHGGRNLGVRPMEMVLIGLGGCTNFDVVSILKKARQPVESCEAFLEAERADEEPKVFTKIHVHFVVKGRGLKEAQVKRAGGAVGGEILLGVDHARSRRGGDHPRLRDRRTRLRRHPVIIKGRKLWRRLDWLCIMRPFFFVPRDSVERPFSSEDSSALIDVSRAIPVG